MAAPMATTGARYIGVLGSKNKDGAAHRAPYVKKVMQIMRVRPRAIVGGEPELKMLRFSG